MYKSILVYSAMFALPTLFTGCGDDSTGPDEPEATTGTLSVTTTTSGPDQDADGYLLTIDGDTEQPADTSGTVRFDELSEGSHTISLSGTSPSCALEGEAEQTVTISAGKEATAGFRIHCKPALINKIVFAGTKGGQPNLYIADPGTIPGDWGLGLTADDVRQSHPDVFPDGTKIAYEANGNIWTVGADGKGKKQLTKSGKDHAPSVYSDGSVVFTSRREGVSQLYIANASGSEEIAITTKNPIYEASCPKGKNPIYEEKSSDSAPIIAARMGRGAEAEIVIIDTGAPKGERIKQLTNNDHYDGQPSWSPDGTELIILTENEKGTKNLRVLDAETGEDKGTTDFRPGFLDDQAYPGWSPDGEELLFTSVGQSKGKIAGPQSMAQDYNSSRSNKPRPLVDVDVDTDETPFSVKFSVWSPRLK